MVYPIWAVSSNAIDFWVTIFLPTNQCTQYFNKNFKHYKYQVGMEFELECALGMIETSKCVLMSKILLYKGL